MTESKASTGLQRGVSRRDFLRLVLVGSGVIATSGVVAGATELAGAHRVAYAAGVDYPQQLKIAHLTDIHYFSKDLWSDCPDFTLAENSDRKMFKESGAIADKALADVVADQPDLIVVSGDLTKDGEQVCHQQIHDKLVEAQAQIKAAGDSAKIMVINGNHDINNHANGKDFSSGSAQDTPVADPLWFKQLYHDCGYDDATVKFDEKGTTGGSLSYVTRPAKGITFIVVDSGKYSADQTASGADEHETSGMVGSKLLAWVCDQAERAVAAGDVVIAMQHHGIVPHFGMEPEVLGEYLVDNYETVAEAYAKAGISCVFTGHMHANDIASATYDGKTIYDVETCATVTYPSDTRYSTLTWGRDAEDPTKVTATLELHSHALGAVNYVDFKTGEAAPIADITAYGKDHLLTVDVVKTMVGDIAVGGLLNTAGGDIKGVLAGLLKVQPDQLDAQLFSMLAGLLPTTQESAKIVSVSSLSIGLWYDEANGCIAIDQVTESKSREAAYVDQLYFTAEQQQAVDNTLAATPMAFDTTYKGLFTITAASFTAFIEPVYSDIDANVLGKPAEVIALAKKLVQAILDVVVGNDGSADQTVFDLLKYAYGDHLYGDETCDAWAETAIANSKNTGSDANGAPVEDGSVTSWLRAGVNGVNSDVKTLLSGVNVNLKLLLLPVSGNFFATIALNLLSNMVKTLGDAYGMLAGDKGLGDKIPNIPQVTDLAYNTLYTLTHDDNTPTDRDFTLKGIALTDPDYQPDNGNGGGGNGGNGGNDSGNNGGNGGNGYGGNNGTTDGNGTGDQGDNGSKGQGGSGAGADGGGSGAGAQGSTGGSNGGTGAQGGSGAASTSGSGSGSKLAQTGDPAVFVAATAAAASAAAVGAAALKAHHEAEESSLD